MKVGLFFGSFNPIHLGHLVIAEAMADQTGLDQVWLVVSPHNPLKPKAQLLNEVDRLHLCELALAGNERVRASNVEFALPKPSYTIDTLGVLSARYPRTSFCLIMGADNLASLHRWKNYEAIVAHYPIYVYPRPGVELPSVHHPHVRLVEAPLMGISATRIRQLLAQGRSARYLVPDPALHYIQSRHLYGHP
ncbi:MAG: nicotinate-nucleotide adenylyltransferase [Bacteroidetes bacterium]|jgi:nicotinate-nucleotide adenylyltransferase|nr:nicotinate-nucleotide adenylyltransferase [Bacteroidota bacterium]